MVDSIIAPGGCGCEDIAVHPEFYGKSWEYVILQLVNKGYRHVQTANTSKGFLSVYQLATNPENDILHVHGSVPA